MSLIDDMACMGRLTISHVTSERGHHPHVDANPTDEGAEYLRYENQYECSNCSTYWEDIWSCMCDDRCPNCNTVCSPLTSIDLIGDEVIEH